MINDLTFFTNEPGSKPLARFNSTLKFIQFFDVLVGYFRSSGFYLLQDAFEGIDKIRILVGLNVDAKAYEIIEVQHGQAVLNFESHRQTQETYAANLSLEMEHSEDREEVECGVRKFIEFLQTGKLIIRAHPSQNIHTKVFISRFNPGKSPDFGRVTTGSSNFSQSGFVDQYVFNVELKNRSDVNYALGQFEKLWAESVDLNETYVDTIHKSTWLNDQITPYEIPAPWKPRLRLWKEKDLPLTPPCTPRVRRSGEGRGNERWRNVGSGKWLVLPCRPVNKPQKTAVLPFPSHPWCTRRGGEGAGG